MLKSKNKFVADLFALNHSQLSGYLSKRLRGHQVEADDVVQETYLRLLRMKDTNAIRNPHAYLFKVASHVVRELGLVENKHLDITDRLVEHSDENTQVASPEQQTVTERQMKELQCLLDQMPDKYKAVLLLRKQQGLSHREIADKLNISTHTVKKYLFRALTFCRENVSQVKGEVK